MHRERRISALVVRFIIRFITASVVVIIVVTTTTAMDTFYDDNDEYSAADVAVMMGAAQRSREMVTYPEGYQPDGGGGAVVQDEDDPSMHYFCGTGFEEASTSCNHPCPSGSMRDCPTGMLCYFNTPCVNSNSNVEHATTTTEGAVTTVNDDEASESGGLSIPIGTDVTIRHPTKSPVTERQLTFFCGSTWADASADCNTWCPTENDTDCPSGQSCFGDTTCIYEPPPTGAPTPDPTEPTISPSPPPQYYGELLPPGASNHMFCGSAVDPLGLGDCTAETHCPNGDIDCDPPGRCWNRDRCDIRNYLSWEEGGYVNRPSHESLAIGMNLTFPSDNPTDHYFCGVSLEEANRGCSRPCPDKTTSNCAHGELCFEGTECDYRVMPGYGATPSPAYIHATLSPIPYDDEMNYKFCGETWGDANTCQNRWCGGNDASSCPPGQSCFADTECNILDRDPTDPPVPTIPPTYAPVMYNDTSNTNFCGATYLAAVDDCSVETHCKSGDHAECEGGGYCWPGVTCNIVDMLTSVPTTYTANPTIDSARPTLSPVVYDLPQNFRFCGTSWAEASASCTDEGDTNPRWCPGGSDDECDDGATCWADTMCNGLDLTNTPTTQPVIMPPSAQLTTSPISESDQLKINIRFCGISYQSALEQCSLKTHCPSGNHVECPDGGYCWSVIGCNIADMVDADATTSPSSSPPDNTTSSSSPPIARELTQPPTTTKTLPTSSSSPTPQQFTESPEGTSLTDVYDYFQSQRTLSPTYEPPTSSPSVDTLTLSEIRDQIYDINISTNSPSRVAAPSTNSPSQVVADVTTTANIYFLPPPLTLSILPRPSKESSALVQRMIQGIKTYIISDFFVVKLRSGTTLPSSLYTYDGFLNSLTFFTNVGIGGVYYLYLGMDHSVIEIEYGICNLALFLAKMMDTISHERCDSNFIACGIPPLGDGNGMTSFQEQDVRVECSPLSSESGMECPNDTGCNCILGMLDHYIGIQSSSTSINEDDNIVSVYSGIDFCEIDVLQSICSRRLEHGEELRWIAPMAHWVYFVQSYDVDGWNYAAKLIDFVDGGMLDSDFVRHVRTLSVLGTETVSNDSDSSMETFQHNFFKVMRKLSEGIAQVNHVEGSTTTTQPTMTPLKSSLVPLTTFPSPSQLDDTTPSSFSSASSHPVLIINEKDPIAAAIIESANDGAASSVATSDKVVVVGGGISPPPSSNKPTLSTSLSPIINPFPWLSVEYELSSIGSKGINYNMNCVAIVALFHLCFIHYYYLFI